MPHFFSDAINGLGDLTFLALQAWRTASDTTRVLAALMVCAVMVFFGSRSERGPVSTIFFFVAFGLFAYIMSVGLRMAK